MKELLEILGLFLLRVLGYLLVAFITMIFWNYLMPILFNLPEISFVQALVLNVLSIIFFKNNYKNT